MSDAREEFMHSPRTRSHSGCGREHYAFLAALSSALLHEGMGREWFGRNVKGDRDRVGVIKV